MSIKYIFDRPTLSFDGEYLAIKNCGKILKFTNISDFNIEGSRVSFSGDYIPEKYEIISFRVQAYPNEHLGRFIEFTHDRTGIKIDFSLDKEVQFLHKEPICYSDVEIVTFTRISDNVQYNKVLQSMGYIHDEETGIIRKDLWTPKEGDSYYFICDRSYILETKFDPMYDSCREHVNIFNCFKTPQEAEIIRDKFLQLLSER